MYFKLFTKKIFYENYNKSGISVGWYEVGPTLEKGWFESYYCNCCGNLVTARLGLSGVRAQRLAEYVWNPNQDRVRDSVTTI